MQNLFLKPALDSAGAAVLVRDPLAGWKALDPNGEWKPKTPYWTRRLRDGDVTIAKPDKPSDPPKPAGDRRAMPKKAGTSAG